MKTFEIDLHRTGPTEVYGTLTKKVKFVPQASCLNFYIEKQRKSILNSKRQNRKCDVLEILKHGLGAKNI